MNQQLRLEAQGIQIDMWAKESFERYRKLSTALQASCLLLQRTSLPEYISHLWEKQICCYCIIQRISRDCTLCCMRYFEFFKSGKVPFHRFLSFNVFYINQELSNIYYIPITGHFLFVNYQLYNQTSTNLKQ